MAVRLTRFSSAGPVKQHVRRARDPLASESEAVGMSSNEAKSRGWETTFDYCHVLA
jgi:hypothetical protein